jgi:hypothetical protein
VVLLVSEPVGWKGAVDVVVKSTGGPAEGDKGSVGEVDGDFVEDFGGKGLKVHYFSVSA